jgi:hypothetical protein
MKKIKSKKKFVIVETNKRERAEGYNNYLVFTKEEYSYGEGLRYPEFDAGSVKECEDFIK